MKEKNNFVIIMLVITLILLCFLIFIAIIQKDEEVSVVDISKNIENNNEEITEKQEVITIIIPTEETEEEIIKIEPIKTQVINESSQDGSTKFYYTQLNEYSIKIYDSLEKQKEKLKTGIEKIKLPEELGEVIEEETSDNLKAFFSIAMTAFEYDNPDIYYIDLKKLALFYERDVLGNYNIYVGNSDEYENYYIDGINSREKQNIMHGIT